MPFAYTWRFIACFIHHPGNGHLCCFYNKGSFIKNWLPNTFPAWILVPNRGILRGGQTAEATCAFINFRSSLAIWSILSLPRSFSVGLIFYAWLNSVYWSLMCESLFPVIQDIIFRSSYLVKSVSAKGAKPAASLTAFIRSLDSRFCPWPSCRDSARESRRAEYLRKG